MINVVAQPCLFEPREASIASLSCASSSRVTLLA